MSDVKRVYILFFQCKAMQEILGAYSSYYKAQIAMDNFIAKNLSGSWANLDTTLTILEREIDWEPSEQS